MNWREYECNDCSCWFRVYDVWDERSLNCPLCQDSVTQLDQDVKGREGNPYKEDSSDSDD